MSLEGLTSTQIAEHEKRLLEAVPTVGSVTNTALREKLSWDDSLYWAIRNRLIDEGHIEKGRGRGGIVRRVAARTSSPGTTRAAAAAPATAGTETRLYEPILKTIKTDWVQDFRADASIAEITAHQGRKETGGRWTRPDITLATYSTYPYVPGKHFDVTTFEVKKHDFVDVTFVYEALAHRRAAPYSYVLLFVPADTRDSLDAVLDDLAYESAKHGVGLVVVENPMDYKTWEVLEDADRNDPDPADLNDFLATQVSQGFKDQLARWFR